MVRKKGNMLVTDALTQEIEAVVAAPTETPRLPETSAAYAAVPAFIQERFALYLHEEGEVLAGPQNLVNIYDLSEYAYVGVGEAVPAGTWIPVRAIPTV